jgi:hypothetical protein
MIVRVSGEAQYRLDEAHSERLGELDNAVIAAVRARDEQGFRDAYDALLEFVRSQGTTIADDDLESSSLILPPPDLSLAEAEREFTGEGLIPD